jgi:hypothetical protein
LAVNGKQVELAAPPVWQGDVLLIWVRDLQTAGLGQVSWDGEHNQAILTTPNRQLIFAVGDRMVTIRTGSGADANEIHGAMPCAPRLDQGRMMVPLAYVCKLLGAGYEEPSRVVASVTLPSGQAGPASATSAGTGTITGKVFLAATPVPGIIASLVSEGFSMIPGQKATSAKDGNYLFTGVPAGSYHVYIYVGDNPAYFNRFTPLLTVAGDTVQAPDIHLGAVMQPLAPKIGEALPLCDVRLSWPACPAATSYTVVATDLQTGEQIFSAQLPAPPSNPPPTEIETTLPQAKLQPGHSYRWSVQALDDTGKFVGGTPGCGSPPWTFSVTEALPPAQPSQ